MLIHVARDGSGSFTSIQQALDSLPSDSREPVTLMIHRGVYQERVTVNRPYITFQGESRDETVLTYGLYARMMMEDGQKRGTFRSYSCLIDADDFTARDMTFANSSGPGNLVGQGLALYGDGDRLVFDNCRFLGGQDTLFTAPLPPKEIEPRGFQGPKEFAPRRNGRHYYRNCYIEGDVDFIFGGATAYFEGCRIHSKYTDRDNFVTAASTPEGQEYGYVMQDCHFTGDGHVHVTYLGRPWREYARTVLIHCRMEEHIRPEGWHDWDKPQAHKHTFYAEYGSYGPGAQMSMRPDWIHRLKPEDLPHYTKEAVLGGADGWNP